MKRLLAFLLVFGLVLFNLTVTAETPKTDLTDILTEKSNEKITYLDYCNDLLPDAEDEIVLLENGDLKLGAGDTNDFPFECISDGSYIIEMEYNANASRDELEIALKLDGEYCFNEISALKMPRIWVNNGEKRTDNSGNESAPAQILWDGFTKQYIFDSEGINPDVYKLSVSSGSHILGLEILSGNIVLKSITLKTPQKTENYKSYKSNLSGKENYNGKPIIIEAEDAVYKTNKTLIPKADNSDPSINPASAT